MKNPTSTALCSLFLLAPASAQTLLFSDNFEVADTTNFDGAWSPANQPYDPEHPDAENHRIHSHSGLLAETIFLRSARAQQHIFSGQVSIRPNSRLRFHHQPLDHALWYNWASEPSGQPILDSGGFRVEFDWTPTNTTSDQWVNISVGFPGPPEPNATRLTHADTDYGILFRNDGRTERHRDNGPGQNRNLGAGGSFPAVETNRHVVIDYAFGSFEDGANVRTRASVNGVRVSEDTFTWNANNGELYIEIETNVALLPDGGPGSLIDNYSVSTLPLELELALDNTTFISGLDPGDTVGTLTGNTFAFGPEDATFEFAEGDGGDFNDLFQIVDNELRIGPGTDFKGENSFDGAQYSIRVRGTGDISEGVAEQVFVLTLVKDDDADGLPDEWELYWTELVFGTGDLETLNGLANGPGPGAGTGDYDGDGISDMQTYIHGTGLYPGLNPMIPDTDGDGLNDLDEINGSGMRPPTSPILADTDGDGLSDLVESGTFIFADENDTGSDPTLADSDGDGARDGFEVMKGSDPNNFSDLPELPPAFNLVPLADETDSGISPSKYYTHRISGGGPATVNGVEFQTLSPTESPSNLIWDISGGGTKAAIAPINNGDWDPVQAGVTGQGLLDLLGGFAYFTNGNPGTFQTYTLTGLTPGETYELRIYTRLWDTEGSGRPIDFEFINGSTVEHPFGALLMDRPGVVMTNSHAAYCITYTYEAESTELTIRASIHESAAPASGSHHLYGLTNEGLNPPEPGAELKITGTHMDGAGNFIIDFQGAPNRTYTVTKSPDLATPFGPLDIPLPVSTNVAGIGQAVIPASEASEPSEFYRIED